MENLLATPLSTPSIKSSDRSSRLCRTPGTPKPPIDPPRRRSSLAFSNIVYPSLITCSTPLQTIGPNNSPLSVDTHHRNISNVGKKRACTTPLKGEVPTPNQHTHMKKIFRDAQTSLHLDAAFASTPGGSIASRLPPTDCPEMFRFGSSNLNGTQHEGTELEDAVKARDWRYSTAPGLLAQAHLDVREPFPESLPLLPTNSLRISDGMNSSVQELVSSGFTTPVDYNMNDDEAAGNDPLILPLPDTSPLSKFMDSGVEMYQRLSSSPPQRRAVLTELEGPLTEMQLNLVLHQPIDGTDSTFITQSRPPSSDLTPPDDPISPDRHIFLSTPAKAAAESARAKRGLPGSALRSTSEKEKIDTHSLCPDPSVHVDRQSSNCPNPKSHHCPDPRLHQFRLSTPTILGPTSSLGTSGLNLRGYHPTPSPLRASLHPPAPYFRRADSSGSPLPILKLKSPPTSPQSYHSKSCQPLPPSQKARDLAYAASTSVAEHFQPGWSHQPAERQNSKPKPLTYAFSTAASKAYGSSAAPDSRIRDSYRTDTLTPLARPASRFKKNGIGAVASVTKGVGRYYANANYSPWPPVTATRPHTSSRHGHASPEQPYFMSSPPRKGGYRQTPVMRRHRRHSKNGDFGIAEDDTASSLPGIVTEEIEPMEIDEDIQAAVRMSIVAKSSASLTVTTPRDVGSADLKKLSPHVTPLRKGKGSLSPRPRRPSYWDQDLPEVRKMDQTRVKRPATIQPEIGRRAAKSMRVSGVRSSPPPMLKEQAGLESGMEGLNAEKSIAQGDVTEYCDEDGGSKVAVEAPIDPDAKDDKMGE